MPAAATVPSSTESVNDVRLVGRLSGDPAERTLPSGDVLVSFRVVVDRPRAARRDGAPTIDTVDCVAWRADARRTVGGCASGDVLEVSGALRRRFWRTGAGAASRTEVEVLRVRRRRRPG